MRLSRPSDTSEAGEDSRPQRPAKGPEGHGDGRARKCGTPDLVSEITAGSGAISLLQDALAARAEDALPGLVGAARSAGDLTEGAEDVTLETEMIEARHTAAQVLAHLQLLAGIQLAVEELIEPFLTLLTTVHDPCPPSALSPATPRQVGRPVARYPYAIVMAHRAS